jgi:A/G-specific adenine glycosylase
MDKTRKKIVWAAKRLAKYIDISLDLPWREERTPYKIFLAEILLVRTRADIVKKVYPSILMRYPNIKDLSNASEAELYNLLKPLGLKKRIPFIINGAKHILENYDGIIPRSLEDLQNIPGIGKYTATAIYAFAFDNLLVPADVNIFRFLARLTGLEIGHKTKGSKELYELLPYLIQEKTNLKPEILIDFSRLICEPRKPKCNLCPLTKKSTYLKKNSM